MEWKELVANPNLQDLPYKIETNEWGQIVMTPTRARHGSLQSRIVRLLDEFISTPGEVVVECAIQTTSGTKVADVAWFSAARWETVKDEYDVSIAPEICVEVLSPGNSGGEMRSKRLLYFAAGAQEVWVCDNDGCMRFFGPTGELEHSALAPDFPHKIG
ncbi:MAG: Uma2 family endonuclease [Caldilineaceae bacterium]|nr:Uma2 family endonuclease [Caldilineaceae bacterium]